MNYSKEDPSLEAAPQINSKRSLISAFEAANEHRDFGVYIYSMDAAEEAKATSMFSHFGDVGEGGVIVDKGSGTGKLAERAARQFRGARVFALDISHELLETAESGKSLIHPVYGNAIEQNFPSNSVDVVYLSTSGHEVESFGGAGSMDKVLSTTMEELKPGGRVVIRDFRKFVSPKPVYMEILSDVGITQVPENAADIDYSLLSTSTLFQRFHQEFAGGNAFNYETIQRDGRTFIKLDAEWAYEFFMRKDYTGNWRQEIKEKYSYWSEEEAKQHLEAAGYEDVEVISETSDYILNNRLKGKVGLYTEEGGQLNEMDFPSTHMVVVGKKPQQRGVNIVPATDLKVEADYKQILSSIKVDKENGVVNVDSLHFEVESDEIIGSNKITYKLKNRPGYVLKIPRADTVNDHSVFKSMYQIVERQQILEKYNTPHMEVVEHDVTQPPYRYLIQKQIPEGSVSAAELIQESRLTESDIRQMAEIVNIYEKSKEWQLDTNPFSWFRVTTEEGETQMVYVSGKVYMYDEDWAFSKVGLLQWLDSKYVLNSRNHSANIPTTREYEELKLRWPYGESTVSLWKRYLDPACQPQ